MALVCIIDLNEHLKAINKELPAGITAILKMDNNRVFASYTVRYESRGKKHGLGTFYDRESAIRALFEHKIKGSTVTPAEELKARNEKMMIDASTQSADALLEVAKPREALTRERIVELLAIKGMYDWQLTGDEAIDVMDDAGVMHTITVEDQRNYNDWKQAGIDAEDNT